MIAMTRQRFFDLLRKTASQWTSHNVPRLGAALAYYTLLSVAPLLVLVVAICGLALDKTTAKQQLLEQVQAMAGPPTANALAAALSNTHHAGTGVFASIAALVTLLFGASGVFVELRESLNTIWDAPPRPSSAAWRDFVWQRLVSFGMVLALGFLLLVSLLLSTALAILTKFFEGYLPVRAAVWSELANVFVPLVAISILFALIFKFVPDVPIKWRDVAIGAVTTAVLFQVGKAILALYLATAGVGSTYGAAGSLVAFVVWVYYSAQIFFFGAIFTRVYSLSEGSYSQSGSSQPLPSVQGNPMRRGASA